MSESNDIHWNKDFRLGLFIGKIFGADSLRSFSRNLQLEQSVSTFIGNNLWEVFLSADQKKMLTAGKDQTIIIYDLSHGIEQIATAPKKHIEWIIVITQF
jgi:hypothetical protein